MEWIVGPTSSWSLRETPFDDFADASKMSRNLMWSWSVCTAHAWLDKLFAHASSSGISMEWARHDPAGSTR